MSRGAELAVAAVHHTAFLNTICSISHQSLPASPVVRGLGLCLSMQGAWVRSENQGDPTCPEAAEPVDLNHRGPAPGACAVQQEAQGMAMRSQSPRRGGAPLSATREGPTWPRIKNT